MSIYFKLKGSRKLCLAKAKRLKTLPVLTFKKIRGWFFQVLFLLL